MPSLALRYIRRGAPFAELRELINPTSKKLMIGIALNAVGGGMTLALLMVYLHDMRGFTNTFNGLLLSWGAIVSIAVSPLMGWLIDHIGPRPVMLTGIIFNGLSALSLAFVSTHLQVIVVMTILSAADQAVRPTQTVVLARVSTAKAREKIFGYRFMFLNLGMGFGGLIGSLIIQEGSLPSFQAMYIVDALTFFIYFAVTLTIKKSEMARHEPEAGRAGRGSYRELFAIRPIMLLGFGNVILFIFGYGALQAGVPVFATQFLHLSPKWLGIIFGANTFAIVIFQTWVMRYIEKFSKHKILIAIGLIWAASWALVGLTPIFPLLISGIALCISQVIFAFGEMLQAPTIPALANQLSPEHIRGRVNAWMSLQWTISGVAGPAICGLMLGANLGEQWALVMFLGCFLPIPIYMAMQKSLIAHKD